MDVKLIEHHDLLRLAEIEKRDTEIMTIAVGKIPLPDERPTSKKLEDALNKLGADGWVMRTLHNFTRETYYIFYDEEEVEYSLVLNTDLFKKAKQEAELASDSARFSPVETFITPRNLSRELKEKAEDGWTLGLSTMINRAEYYIFFRSKPSSEFKCDTCGKSFANARALGGHKGKCK